MVAQPTLIILNTNMGFDYTCIEMQNDKFWPHVCAIIFNVYLV